MRKGKITSAEVRSLALIFSGGLLGGIVIGIVALVYAFQFDHIPFTNNGVDFVLTGAMPAGLVCGGMVGALIAHRWNKRKLP